MDKKEFNEVLDKILEARAAKKASLKGIERMRYNLYWKVYPWFMRNEDYRVVSIGELAEKVAKYAPKAIRNNRSELEAAINEIYAGYHGVSIFADEDRREDLEFEMDWFFNRTKAA
ncbi:MAG: hypothetical protein LBC40_00875 [Dysgonamonadaceae bacterium]|jgi:hypothetical protein|nr:hypothetical protein [Dysgonamonadaceae bacterium]